MRRWQEVSVAVECRLHRRMLKLALDVFDVFPLRYQEGGEAVAQRVKGGPSQPCTSEGRDEVASRKIAWPSREAIRVRENEVKRSWRMRQFVLLQFKGKGRTPN